MEILHKVAAHVVKKVQGYFLVENELLSLPIDCNFHCILITLVNQEDGELSHYFEQEGLFGLYFKLKLLFQQFPFHAISPSEGLRLIFRVLSTDSKRFFTSPLLGICPNEIIVMKEPNVKQHIVNFPLSMNENALKLSSC